MKPRQISAGKYSKWVANILNSLPDEHKIDPAEFNFVVLDNEHYGARSLAFTNESPNTIIVMGPNYGNHRGVYSRGPIISLAAHSMGAVISHSFIYLEKGSFPRDILYGKAIIRREDTTYDPQADRVRTYPSDDTLFANRASERRWKTDESQTTSLDDIKEAIRKLKSSRLESGSKAPRLK